MSILPRIEKLKLKLNNKRKFFFFYRKLYKKIKFLDKKILSFISLNKNLNFKKNNNLPLQNIPILIKDLIHLKGTICTSGSLVFKNRISLASATIVNRLINAGSQIIGKNNLVEFAYGSWGTNNFFGTPVNPRDKKLKRVCGGSSSGSAAAVASGFVSASIGTDTLGSIRVPAAYCGIYGLKTSPGRIPLDGIEKLCEEFDTVGIFANYIDDINKVFKVISDNYRIPKDKNFKLLKISDNFYNNFNKKIFSQYKKFLGKLEKENFFISEINLKKNSFYVNECIKIVSYRGYNLLKKYIENKDYKINDDVRERLIVGKKINYKNFLKINNIRKKHVRSFKKIIQNNLIIAPVTKTFAPPINKVDQNIIPSEYCRFVNYLDLCSITFTINSHSTSSHNLPIALQVIAKKGNEEICIEFVKKLISKKIIIQNF